MKLKIPVNDVIMILINADKQNVKRIEEKIGYSKSEIEKMLRNQDWTFVPNGKPMLVHKTPKSPPIRYTVLEGGIKPINIHHIKKWFKDVMSNDEWLKAVEIKERLRQKYNVDFNSIYIGQVLTRDMFTEVDCENSNPSGTRINHYRLKVGVR